MQERRIDDYRNIDGSRDLSASWKGFTQFTLLSEKPLEGYMWSGWRLTKRQVTVRPDLFWLELWTKLGRNAKLREKHKLVNWKTESSIMLRRLRGIYFIDPEDMKFKEIIEECSKAIRNTSGSSMPCKTCKKNKHFETRGKTGDFRSKFACILEASESTRTRVEESLPSYREDHIAVKGDT